MGRRHKQSPCAGNRRKWPRSIQRRKELNWLHCFLLHASVMLSQEAMGAYLIDSQRHELILHLLTKKPWKILLKQANPSFFKRSLCKDCLAQAVQCLHSNFILTPTVRIL